MQIVTRPEGEEKKIPLTAHTLPNDAPSWMREQFEMQEKMIKYVSHKISRQRSYLDRNTRHKKY